MTNLLFTEFSADKIASITTDGVVTESPVFIHSSPTGITAGVGQKVWFLGTFTNRVYETVVPRYRKQPIKSRQRGPKTARPRQGTSAAAFPALATGGDVLSDYFAARTAGGTHDPSRIDGAFSLGQ